MAIVSNPAFAGFDAAGFRESIKSTMQMGSPNAVADKVTFRWTDQRTYASSSPTGVPYSLAAVPVTTTHKDDLQVDCAVEFFAKNSLDTPFGAIHNARLIITLLDVDYDLIKDADTILYGQNTYMIEYTAPPIGLFDVTVYSMHAVALDET